MSLKDIASDLAKHGRGPDTELVHMTKGEVHALQKIAKDHGGSLSINPHTGLPEAGWLSQLLPTIAGIGLSFIPGVGPFMAAGLVGGATALAKGSVKKGLLAGLGAYGGASLGASLGAAGAGTAAPAAGGIGAGAPAAGGAELAAVTPPPTVVPPVAAPLPVSPGNVPPMAGMEGSGINFAKASGTALGDNAARGAASFGPTPFNNFASMGADTGVSQVASLPSAAPALSPEAAKAAQQAANTAKFNAMGPSERFASMGRGLSGENLMGFAKEHPFITGGTLMSMMPGEKKLKEEPEDTYLPKYSYNKGTDEGVFSSPDYEENVRRGREMNYFNNRGFTKVAAKGGVMHGGLNSSSANLGSYSDGGRLLRGPGDGVSDSIPAVIGKKQPARLADGEFVIPARIVSELGNGSTEAGARRLYAMMDRIQKARKKSIGKNKVAHNSRAEKHLPA
jgi:hypothetical protein